AHLRHPLAPGRRRHLQAVEDSRTLQRGRDRSALCALAEGGSSGRKSAGEDSSRAETDWECRADVTKGSLEFKQMDWVHENVTCLNQYETIRKYRCAECGGVFMCACEQDWALTFLPHQTRAGSEFGTGLAPPLVCFRPGPRTDCKSRR